MRTWIDFKKVKGAARFEPVLARYGLELKPRGKELVGNCPFHEEERPSFSVNPEKGVFHCFGCSAKGNVLDFVARKESVTIRRAAELLADWLNLGDAVKTAPRPSQAQRTRPREEGNPPPEASERPEPRGEGSSASPQEEGPAAKPKEPATTEGEGNRPLSFSLKLNPEHPYLAKRGIDRALAEFFGIGFCSRGMMKGRIAVPLHNEHGELVGYLGRWPGPEPPAGEEKYKLPPGFKKSEVLYNLHRVSAPEHLVLVEGVWSVFRLHRLDVPAVALLGRSLSTRQEELLLASGVKRLTLLLDGDPPGREAAKELLPRLARAFFVRVAELPDGTQPDTLAEETLRALLGGPTPTPASTS